MTPSNVRVSRPAALSTLIGLVLLALNLRAAISGVSPLLDELQRSFGLSGAAMGVLTTLPVLCLGAFAALAPPLARRLGTERALTGALLLIGGGILLRLVPLPGVAAAPLFLGTAVAGAGIAIGNVLMPYVIKSTFPNRVGLLTGLAMMLMSTGAALSSGLAVPLDGMGGWRLALAVWSIPALLAAAVWAPMALRSRGAGTGSAQVANDSTPGTEGGSLLRNRLAWHVTLFLGMQSLAFYVLMSWLPAIMRDQGYPATTAGLMLSVMMLLGIPSGLVMPMLAARRTDQRPLVVGVMALMALGVGGLLLAPGQGWLWVVVLGFGTGSAFPLAYTLVTLRSATPRVAARLSGMAQTTGYLLAGAGPFLFGVMNGATGGWNVPLLILLVWLVPETLFALRAARPAVVGGPPAIAPVGLPLHAASFERLASSREILAAAESVRR
ncbi:CynX/NimT family MFS transporter [Thermomonospora umbrina]|uniref:CP family cyanate transporter-like MFS transporter n=1 Tax=Thermomonospora umbrina TaxID=111806 RepID=A0A3D9SMR4_9ACTN|nr:MFS transporter [Thermomonospora umbrina]REE97216.1 CP family cyanate transporter-like MFS transporter [Thermomonospora umbrina]